mmetsp:Transcript_89112/g.238837  ORF Transcript_89112/g.238837 Transcript_89112/m.238837 type:complete len:238 (+) Transcript_89112:508-1221(+)
MREIRRKRHPETNLHWALLHCTADGLRDRFLIRLDIHAIHPVDHPADLNLQLRSLALCDLGDDVSLNLHAQLGSFKFDKVEHLHSVVAVVLRVHVVRRVLAGGLVVGPQLRHGPSILHRLRSALGAGRQHPKLGRRDELGEAVVVRGELRPATRALTLRGAELRSPAGFAHHHVGTDGLLDRTVQAQRLLVLLLGSLEGRIRLADLLGRLGGGSSAHRPRAMARRLVRGGLREPEMA